MNLVYRYFELGIEGMPSTMLQQILEGSHPTKVKVANNGMIMLSTNRVIKCVKHYYASPDGPLVTKKVSNECYYVQQGLGIKNVSNYQCTRCHLECLEMRRQGTLLRKK